MSPIKAAIEAIKSLEPGQQFSYRKIAIQYESQPLLFNGKLLDEDYGDGMDDVKASKKLAGLRTAT
ncbi:hypothetical protein SNOG_07869 [Parastagonospora nodorum SN15]|uniref:Uncharacterized protein n=1 Tax=Phaeosphaeria nodorum (strain SN15 / ATCC MYA-4574 / FGSC 10173) TaxID=321614 RepID=Q0UK45_PHANO|nr:hypothetical protein SNOG_07869 [Parastagonospora nodorum SN15]EAT85335.1 hypothetical protein SNOG_07869 [Parastagonospora nodorum SN15]